ncbi:MAG: SEC-C domain-containing protein [Pseudomonadales bacterium]|nr:SEC-C domain-containing protein [Halieaceae bacterium]MCP5163934.1 SEC-C domain-containing protein [Pseudomonadales bacterium]MCP5189030.1 SEC-C domain-containing protein [Pseudomonadales bacterium]MCP5202984.1 SEC-C domain-containing protein [Pseudomonadales bacterium]
MAESCVCGSNKSYRRCCGRFLDNGERAKTPEQLMRSRYSAYALGKHGDYLLQTWFPATAGGLSAAQLSEVSCQWLRLEILAKAQQGDKGWVEFNAWYRGTDGSEQVLHEKSVFQRHAGRWLYVGGEVSDKPG